MTLKPVILAEVAAIERNGVSPAALSPTDRYVGLEHIDSDGAISSRETAASADLKSTKFRFTDSHVLFGKLRPYLRKIARPNWGGVCSTDILPIRPGKDLSRDYLCHFLRTPEMVGLATQRCSGANLPRLSPKQLETFEIPLPHKNGKPDLDEQKRIAAILDKADAIRRKRQQALRLTDDFLRSVFLDMFGDPVNNPKGWDELKFGELVESTKLGMIRSSKEFGWDLPVPYVRMDALSNDGAFLPNKVQGTDATEADIEKHGLEPDDFLFNTRNSKELVGKVAVYPGPSGATYNNNLMRIRFKKAADPYFICQQFQFARVQRELEARKQGTTSVFAVYWKNLQTLPILCPPRELQKDFRAIVDKIVATRVPMGKEADEAEDLSASLQQRAFRGEL